MTEMTKKERLEHTRSLLNAIPIIRLYDEIGKKKHKKKLIKIEFTKNEHQIMLTLLKCEKCIMSDETVLPSYKAQLTKLIKKFEGS